MNIYVLETGATVYSEWLQRIQNALVMRVNGRYLCAVDHTLTTFFSGNIAAK